MAARVAELEAQVARAPVIDRASLYRMVSALPYGALAVNRGGSIDFANPAMERWMTVPAPAAGQRVAEALIPALYATLAEATETALAGQDVTLEAALADAAGELRALRLQIAPRFSGAAGVTGWILSLHDQTEAQALDRAARERQEHLARVNAVTPSANYLFDFSTGRPTWVGGDTMAVYGHSVEELVAGGGDLVRSLIHPDDFRYVGERLSYLADRPDGEVAEFELRVLRPDGGYRWILDRALVFERDATGRIVKTLSAAIDIDARKRAEERRTLLINELNHRVKNTLAAVQSIARQTLRSGGDPKASADLFTARLVSLSAAHDVLTRENWEGASLREIAQVALAPFDDSRISLDGPELRLGARGALALSMALHELATNATKYGALSQEGGRVSLAWRARPDDGAWRVDLTWQERGGPAVVPPRRRGFGTRLLTQGLKHDLHGDATLAFAPEGLICRITAPLETPPRPALPGAAEA